MYILLPLSITLAIETLVYLLFYKVNKKVFIIASISNVVLNVAMNFGLSYVEDQIIYWVILVIAEIATIVVESLMIFLIAKQKYLKTLIVAIIANTSSFLIGIAVFPIYEMRITPIVVTSIFFFIYLLEAIYTFFLHSFFRKMTRAS